MVCPKIFSAVANVMVSVLHTVGLEDLIHSLPGGSTH